MNGLRNQDQGVVVWLTGLPGAGKTTIANAAARAVIEAGRAALVLDGDRLREGLCEDLGFSPEDRRENVRRAGEVARLLSEQGAIVLCALVSPTDRLEVDAAVALVLDRLGTILRTAGTP